MQFQNQEYASTGYEHVYSQIGATLQFFYTVYELPNTYIYIYGSSMGVPNISTECSLFGLGGGGGRTVKIYLKFKKADLIEKSLS